MKIKITNHRLRCIAGTEIEAAFRGEDVQKRFRAHDPGHACVSEEGDGSHRMYGSVYVVLQSLSALSLSVYFRGVGSSLAENCVREAMWASLTVVRFGYP